ncbi:putative zinc ribbon protein [Citrobacter portucalensis]|uniref:putative zinc ribbon protein n=1 Tax=Citrobacter portucalensis TaxID=1639133 RepID=UPI0023B2D305|nr:putative zinc ribbon protein [Citrobacter portucalensis]MDE9702794.1 zinc-ribbon domain-containing protein [Citrobacter portucalensis]
MLMMPCHLALNSKGAMRGARSAVSKPGENWSCSSCGCRLVLHPGDISEHPWFEHDQASANESALLYCQYRNHRDGLPGERFRVMLYSIREHEVRMVSEAWYCVWCGRHYVGEKHCVACNTGIYSIEETAWRENYTCPVDYPSQHSPEERGASLLVSGGRWR